MSQFLSTTRINCALGASSLDTLLKRNLEEIGLDMDVHDKGVHCGTTCKIFTGSTLNQDIMFIICNHALKRTK